MAGRPHALVNPSVTELYRYVWRDDLSDTFDESVRVWLSVGRQSVCLVRATVPDPL